MTTVPRRPIAQFVISIDLEMSWGAIHHGHPHDDSPYRQERQVVADVLQAFDTHGIAATWAVVGHLFLASCSAESGTKHPELARPDYPWLAGDWYDLDPCQTVEESPTWYGPDLVDAIRSSATAQEIGSHTFGHLIVGEPGVTKEAFRTDLAACRKAASESGVDLRSFVYPRNSIGHLDLLETSGFTAYRSNAPERFGGLSPWRRRVNTVVDRIWPLRSAIASPSRTGTLTDIPQTYLFDPGSDSARRFGTGIWSRQIRRRLRHAVRTQSLFHMWFHTHNLSEHRRRAVTALDVVLSDARRHIDAGRLENLTMGQVADRLGSSSDVVTRHRDCDDGG